MKRAIPQKIFSRKMFFLIGISLYAFILGACGGGGGGGAGLTYTGKTTQASVSPENSGKILSDVQEFGAGLRNEEISFLKPGKTGTQPDQTTIMFNIMQHIRAAISNQNRHFAANKVVPINETELGSCGGNLTITGTFDDVTEEINLNFHFNQFCENGTTTSGTINAQGNETQFTVTYSAVTITRLSNTVSIAGTVDFEIHTTNQSTMTMNAVVQDHLSGKSFQLENYRVTATESETGTTFNISGRFFSSDEGFIDITTITPFFVANANEFPSSGVLEILGSNGTKARLTATNSTGFKLEVDADGNGTFEWMVSGPWEVLENTSTVS